MFLCECAHVRIYTCMHIHSHALALGSWRLILHLSQSSLHLIFWDHILTESGPCQCSWTGWPWPSDITNAVGLADHDPPTLPMQLNWLAMTLRPYQCSWTGWPVTLYFPPVSVLLPWDQSTRFRAELAGVSGCGTSSDSDRTEVLVHAWQALCHLSSRPSPCFLWILS